MSGKFKQGYVYHRDEAKFPPVFVATEEDLASRRAEGYGVVGQYINQEYPRKLYPPERETFTEMDELERERVQLVSVTVKNAREREQYADWVDHPSLQKGAEDLNRQPARRGRRPSPKVTDGDGSESDRRGAA